MERKNSAPPNIYFLRHGHASLLKVLFDIKWSCVATNVVKNDKYSDVIGNHFRCLAKKNAGHGIRGNIASCLLNLT